MLYVCEQILCMGTAALMQGINRQDLEHASKFAAVMYDWTSATLKSKMGSYVIGEIMKERGEPPAGGVLGSDGQSGDDKNRTGPMVENRSDV